MTHRTTSLVIQVMDHYCNGNQNLSNTHELIEYRQTKAGFLLYNTQGGGAEKLCLPLDPGYINDPQSTSATYTSTLYDGEYKTHNGLLYNQFSTMCPAMLPLELQ